MKINVYDFDNTIYDGDSSIDFFKYELLKNKKNIKYILPFLWAIVLYYLKIKEKEYVKSKMFSFLKSIKNLDNEVEEFWQKNEYKIKEFYKKEHKETDYIVSASPYFLLEYVAKKYKFNLIASEVNKKTGHFEGKNCYGEEKVNRLKSLTKPKIENFYSDSLSDEPLAKISQNAYIINKNEIVAWDKYKPAIIKKIKKFIFDRDFIMFVIIGIVNVFNGVVLALLFNRFIINHFLAYTCGFLVSLSISYIYNSVFNFKSKICLRKYISFEINNIPNYLIQITNLFIFIKILNINKYISYTTSAIVSVPITFILVKINVFKKRS